MYLVVSICITNFEGEEEEEFWIVSDETCEGEAT